MCVTAVLYTFSGTPVQWLAVGRVRISRSRYVHRDIEASCQRYRHENRESFWSRNSYSNSKQNKVYLRNLTNWCETPVYISVSGGDQSQRFLRPTYLKLLSTIANGSEGLLRYFSCIFPAANDEQPGHGVRPTAWFLYAYWPKAVLS